MTGPSLRERTRGRWYGILTGIGLDPSFLRNKHGPCPVCGGTDRFRWDDKNGDGTFYCNQCQPHAGSGIDLVMRIKELTFRDAAPLIENYIGTIGTTPAQPEPKNPSSTAAKEQARKDVLNDLWRLAKPVQRNDTVDRWLHNRELDLAVFPSALRHHPSVLHPGPPRSFHPAMIAMVQDPAGRPVTIHKTYLTADGQKAPVESARMFMTGTITPGSAVRLIEAGPKLGIAEGIETALAVMKLFGFPCWAALTAGGIERFQPPRNVETLMIMADNDDNDVGRRVAEKLAGRLSIKCEINVPGQGKGDWNDVWKGAQVSGKKPKELAIRYTPAMLQSAALRVLPPLATKTLHAFEAQLVCAGANGERSVNGELKVPQSLVLEWMCSSNKRPIPLAIRHCVALGFLRNNGRYWRLTYFPVWEAPPTNEWNQIRTVEEAEAIIGKKPRRQPTGEYRNNIDDGTWPKRKRRAGIGHNGGPAFSASADPPKLTETNKD